MKVSPDICTAVGAYSVPLVPLPLSPSPQQYTAPPVVSAQVCALPAEMAAILPSTPVPPTPTANEAMKKSRPIMMTTSRRVPEVATRPSAATRANTIIPV